MREATALRIRKVIDDNSMYAGVGINKNALVRDDHAFLIQFIQSDINDVLNEVKEGVKRSDHSRIIAAGEKLGKVHPYFEDHRRVCEYINRSIAVFLNENHEADLAEFAPVLKELGIFEKKMKTDWRQWDRPEAGTVFSLCSKQSDIKKAVALIFNGGKGEYANIPFQVKAGLYGIATGKKNEEEHFLRTTVNFYLPRSVVTDRMREAMAADTKYAVSVYDAINRYIETNELTGPLKNITASAGDAGDNSTKAYVEYEIEKLEDLIDLEIYMLLTEGRVLKKCTVCGRYFVATHDSSDYCSVPGENGKTCLMEAGKYLRGGELAEIYKKAYNTHYTRMRRGTETKEELDAFRKKAEELRGRVYAGELSVDEFQEELKAYDKTTADDKEKKKNIAAIHANAYRTHYARIRKGTETDEDMEQFKKLSAKLRPRVMSGEITLEEFHDIILKKQN